MSIELADLERLIAESRARVQTLPSETVNVVLGSDGKGQFVPVTITKLAPGEWLTLEAMHPPRPDVEGDERLGSNLFAIPADYPIGSVKVAGNDVPVEMWREIVAVLDDVHLENVAALMYGLNRAAALMQVESLGKASAGGRKRKPVSPASSASRSADSKGGSPQK